MAQRDDTGPALAGRPPFQEPTSPSPDPVTVLVTGMGGNVGQGIVRNIRSVAADIRVVGTNIRAFSAGNHLCDTFHLVPYADDPGYIETLCSIVVAEQVKLVLPSTDLETLCLAERDAVLGAKVLASDLPTVQIYHDKLLSYQHHLRHGMPFAESCLPSEYDGRFDQFIVKPRSGRGSRGLHRNPEDLAPFDDDEYMVQPLLSGPELTTAFYVTTAGRLHGSITLERELSGGATQHCRVTSAHDDQIQPLIEQMVSHSGFRGSVNVQSICTQDNEVWPFEVNCRISGTNSIRSQFGFCDVKYALQEHLYGHEPDEVKVTNGVATRILLDVIYPHQTYYDDASRNHSDHYVF